MEVTDLNTKTSRTMAVGATPKCTTVLKTVQTGIKGPKQFCDFVPLEVADSSVKRYVTQDFPVTIAAPASNVELTFGVNSDDADFEFPIDSGPLRHTLKHSEWPAPYFDYDKLKVGNSEVDVKSEGYDLSGETQFHKPPGFAPQYTMQQLNATQSLLVQPSFVATTNCSRLPTMGILHQSNVSQVTSSESLGLLATQTNLNANVPTPDPSMSAGSNVDRESKSEGIPQGPTYIQMTSNQSAFNIPHNATHTLNTLPTLVPPKVNVGIESTLFRSAPNMSSCANTVTSMKPFLATQVKDSTEHTSDVTICSLDTATLATSATHTMITSALRPSQIFGNNLPSSGFASTTCVMSINNASNVPSLSVTSDNVTALQVLESLSSLSSTRVSLPTPAPLPAVSSFGTSSPLSDSISVSTSMVVTAVSAMTTQTSTLGVTSQSLTQPIVVVKELQRVKTYSGHSSYKTFRTHFERVSKANGWTTHAERVPHLTLALDGAALEAIQGISEDADDAYEQIWEALARRFGYVNPKEVAVRKFDNCKQTEGQTVVEFEQTLRMLFKEAWPSSDPAERDLTLKYKFENGLNQPEMAQFFETSCQKC